VIARRRPWRALTCLLAVSMTAASAAPLGDNTVRLAPSQLKLPQNIGPLRYSGERRFSDRRLGRSFAYNTSGISLSIYVYDYGMRAIPEGDSAPLCEQFESAKREIERGGNYENVMLRGEFSRLLGEASQSVSASQVSSSPMAREALYEFDRHGVHAVSVLWLTAVDGHFLKLRLSLRSEVADELDEAREQILGAIAMAIENRRRPRRPAQAEPLPQEASIEVDGGDDPETAALWLTYAARLVAFTREHPHTRPPCGGPLVAGFAAELAARRAALDEYRRSATRWRAPYFEQLLRIDEAGLLEEYVWHYLRNERWDTVPPTELDLPSFDRFRERELVTHHVQSGARIRINAVRPLPIAPAPR
jgi:hypothetical protein